MVPVGFFFALSESHSRMECLAFTLSKERKLESDNSLKRLRIALKSEWTIEKTTRHKGKSFLLKNIKLSAKKPFNVFPYTNLCKFKLL